MTAVPVVSATLTTRTEHVCGQRLCRLPYCKTLVVDPVFVPLPEAPDLRCRTCGGKGYVVDRSTPLGHRFPDCSSCGGSGVSPVYAATWQVKVDRLGSAAPWGEWTSPFLRIIGWPSDPSLQRQVVEWRATDVTPLPVVDNASCAADWPDRCLIVDSNIPGATFDFTNGMKVICEPWAYDLRPGQFVLRLDGWEHLQQPHTEMVEPPRRLPDAAISGHRVERRSLVEVRAPLSVPDGVLSWIELAS